MAGGLIGSVLDRAVRRPDVGVCLRLNHWGVRSSVRRYFTVISRLGDGPLWYALIFAFPLLDPGHRWEVSAQMAIAGVLALVLYRWLKRHTRRPRPYVAHREILALTAPLDEFSFPSGHTLHAVSFSTVALAHEPLLAVVLVPFTASVALSRVVLGLHYPSDVLVAFGIGAVLGNLVLAVAPGIGL